MTPKTVAALEGATHGESDCIHAHGTIKEEPSAGIKWEITGKAYKDFAALPCSSQIKPELDEEIRR